MIFSSQTQKELRATFSPYSAEVTANNNTVDVFQYKTNNNKDERSYTCVFPYASRFY